MKLFLIVIPAGLLIWWGISSFMLSNPHPEEAFLDQSFHDLSIEAIDGGTITFSDFKGKYVLCVNVTSRCGYTPQYKDLQSLYETYSDKLVIIGFPCNQFLGQEPGSNAEIAAFCERNYGVTFPLSTKIDVKGKNQHTVYQWLVNQPLEGHNAPHEVKWNFHKFLVGPDGRLIGNFSHKVNPRDEQIVSLIKSK